MTPTETPTTCTRCGRPMKHTPLSLHFGAMTFECLRKTYGAGSAQVDACLAAGAAHGNLLLSTTEPVTLTELLDAVLEWCPLVGINGMADRIWRDAQLVADVHGLELPPLAELQALAEGN